MSHPFPAPLMARPLSHSWEFASSRKTKSGDEPSPNFPPQRSSASSTSSRSAAQGYVKTRRIIALEKDLSRARERNPYINGSPIARYLSANAPGSHFRAAAALPPSVAGGDLKPARLRQGRRYTGSSSLGFFGDGLGLCLVAAQRGDAGAEEGGHRLLDALHHLAHLAEAAAHHFAALPLRLRQVLQHLLP